MNYTDIKENVKILVEKYANKYDNNDNNINNFIEYIDNINSINNFKINKTLVCQDLYDEIILINNLINEFKDNNNGNLYDLWNKIYIKYFNPIIIIGAGVAGLTIASGLINTSNLINASDLINESSKINASKFNKENLLILEARDRLGGRVFTNDKNMDMGAAWIHGSENNPLNKFLDYSNLIPVADSNPWMHSENTKIKYLCDKYNISEEQRQILASKWNNIIKNISPDDNKSITDVMSQLNIDDDLYSFLYLIEVWCGGSVKKITSSFLTSGIFGDYNGPHYLFKNGAKTLIESIINSAKESYYDKIKYNQVVTDIIYNDYYVQVHTKNGNIYYCNKVCITVPPKPLKSINFSPPLDDNRLDILSKIKMGSYKKIQLEFQENEIFWQNNVPMILTYNPNTDAKEYYQKNNGIIPYILWNNYIFSKNKPILEAICPADIGFKLAGKSDEEIVDIIMTHLRIYYPNAPDPKA
jgi:hypothetical protein